MGSDYCKHIVKVRGEVRNCWNPVWLDGFCIVHHPDTKNAVKRKIYNVELTDKQGENRLLLGNLPVDVSEGFDGSTGSVVVWLDSPHVPVSAVDGIIVKLIGDAINSSKTRIGLVRKLKKLLKPYGDK